VAVERERLRRRMIDLLDLVAEDAAGRGDAVEAARLLEQAITLEPYDGSRYESLATLLASGGRRGSARDVVARGLAAALDLGVDPTPGLSRLAEELAGSL
jgi:DNA-binding SARP family transcriptional activator